MRAHGHPSAKPALPLLLLPGTLCDGRIFEPLRQRLPPLKGEVAVTPDATTLQEAAGQVLARAPERFALLGFSLGGMVALEVALRAPERVSGLALLSTTPLPVPPERHAERRAAVRAAQTMPMSYFIREQLLPEYGGPPEDAFTLPLLEQMAQDLGAATFALQTDMALQRTDFRPRLRSITCPTLVLAGSADVLCPPSTQQHLIAGLPRSTSVMLPGAGHFALTEQPDEVASAVAAWFHTLEAADHGSNAAPAHGTTAREID